MMLGEAYLVLTSLTPGTQKTRDLTSSTWISFYLSVEFSDSWNSELHYKELKRYPVPETNRIKESLWQVDSFKFWCQMHHIVFCCCFQWVWKFAKLRFCFENPKEQSDPTARYTLNLMHPQHRALLRMLLRCQGWKTSCFPMFYVLRKLRISFQLFLQIHADLVDCLWLFLENRKGKHKGRSFCFWNEVTTCYWKLFEFSILRRCRSQSRPVTELFKFED